MESELYNPGRARRSLMDTVAFRVLSQAATVLSYVVLVRGMSEEQFGVLNLLYSFIPVVGTLLSLGLEQVLIRYQPEYLRAGNKVAAAWLFRVIASSRFLINIGMLAVVLLAWNWVAPVFKLTPYRLLFASFSLLILLHFQARMLQLALASHMMHRYSVGSMSLLAIVKLVLYTVLYWRDALTLEAAIVVDTVAYACAYGAMRLAYTRQVLTAETRGSFSPEPAEKKRLVRYGLYNNFNDAGVLLLYSTVDNFFIAAFLDTLSVGIYSFYSRLRQMVINTMPVKLFENVIRPMFFAIPKDEADQAIPRYFTFLLNMNLLLIWPAFAFMAAFHHELVQVVFAGKFIEDSWLLVLFMSFGVVNIVADPVSIVAQYDEKAGILLLSKLFAAYNLAAMFVFVPAFGIYGAALAALTAQTFKNLFIWWYVRQRARWLNAAASMLWSAGIWGAFVGLCYVLKTVIPAGPLVQMLVGIPLFVVAGLLYVRSPVLARTDREMLTAVAPDKVLPLCRKLGLM